MEYRTRITHPDGPWFDTAYDALGRPVSIADPTTARYLASYAPHGAPLGVIRNNRTLAIYGYDAIQRLGYIAMGHDFPGYAEDVMIMLDRNPAGQIATMARSNDAYAWTGAYAVNRPYTTNGLNQYIAAGGTALDYDDNGNLISETTQGVTRTYTYDTRSTRS